MPRRRKGQNINGWLVLDKPLEISSTGALGRARWLLDAKKAGHGGTLDPLATGVLPLAFGEATKTLSFILERRKTYIFDVTFGTATNTADAEGDICETSGFIPTAQDIERVLPAFTGPIKQTPPAYSAIKVDGERAYKKARSGEEVKLKARDVTVHALRFSGLEDGVASFEADVSKGTYIRSLGVDIAKAAGSCGHISRLRRTRVGQMTLEGSITLDDLEKKVAKASGKGHIPENLLFETDWALDDIPALAVSSTDADRLRHGKQITLPQAPEGLVRAKTEAGALVSLLEVASDKSTTIVRNFNDIA